MENCFNLKQLGFDRIWVQFEGIGVQFDRVGVHLELFSRFAVWLTMVKALEQAQTQVFEAAKFRELQKKKKEN